VIIDTTTGTARLDEPPPNLPLGVQATTYTSRRLSLPAHGKLLTFTDGLYERSGTTITDSLQAVVDNATRLAHCRVDDLADALLAAAQPTPPGLPDDLALIVVSW
jgi:hypothetical protein